MNPTTRSKAYLEKQGFIVTKVEQKIKFPVPGRPQVQGTILRDAFGFGDLLFCGNGQIGLCQTTSGKNKASRITKILELTEARTWLESGGKILVHGWAKRGPRGKRKTWDAGESIITLKDASVTSENSSPTLGDIPLPPKRQERGKSNPRSEAPLFNGVIDLDLYYPKVQY